MHGRDRRNVGGNLERAGQRSFDGPKHEVVHELRVAEADLELRRMRVDVDAPRVERRDEPHTPDGALGITRP